MKLTKLLSVVLAVSILLCSLGLTAFATNTDETIPALPTATVTEISNDNLTFALNFKADEVTQAQLDYYGDWYADFVLTLNKTVTFNANDSTSDGYLSGQYDTWSENWVDVPFEEVTLEAGTSLKIMEYAAQLMGKDGLKVTYNDVYTSVKDFDCGVYFNPKFLANNPDLDVTLELRMYNPADETESYVIGRTYTYEAQQADFTYYFDEATGKLTISGSGVMPQYSSTNPAPWKEYADSITELEISDGITTIGRQAFIGLTALEELTIPESVAYIGSYAFLKSTGIKTLNISNVNEIGSNAFTGCDNLETVNFTGTVAEFKALKNNVAGNIPFLRAAATITDDNGTVAGYAGMSLYATWVYNAATKTIEIGNCPGKDAHDMLNYNTVTVAPWSQCDIEKVVIDGVTSVGSRAFYNDASVKNVKLGETVTAINTWSFYNTELSSVQLPASLTKIGTGAFYKVEDAKIKSAATLAQYEAITLGSSNLDFSRSTATLADAVKGWHSSKVNWYVTGSKLVITGTGEMAAVAQPWAEYADSITEIEIAEGITAIGKQAFAGFTNVTEITIPSTVTEIRVAAFKGMTKLTTVNLPANLTTVGTYAFSDCDSLATVNFAGDAASLTIGGGNNAFKALLK